MAVARTDAPRLAVPAAPGLRDRLLRHPGIARLGVVILLFIVWKLRLVFSSTAISSAPLRSC